MVDRKRCLPDGKILQARKAAQGCWCTPVLLVSTPGTGQVTRAQGVKGYRWWGEYPRYREKKDAGAVERSPGTGESK